MKTYTCIGFGSGGPSAALLRACPRAAGQGGLLRPEEEERVRTQSLQPRFPIAVKPTKRPEVYQGGCPDPLGPSSDLQRVQRGCSTGRKYCFPAQVKFSAGLASRMVSPPGQMESAEAQGTRWEAPKDRPVPAAPAS